MPAKLGLDGCLKKAVLNVLYNIYIYVYISIYKYNRKSVVEIQYSNMHTRESEYCLRNITLYIYLPVKATIATRDTAKEYRIHFKYSSF